MSADDPSSFSPHRPRRAGRQAVATSVKQRHPITVRLTDAEHVQLVAEAARFRLSQGEVLRAVWQKGNTWDKLVTPPTPEQARELAQLAGMAANLNQLTKQGHQGQDIRDGATILLRKMNALLNQLSPAAR